MSKTYYHPSCNDPVWLEEGFRINESVFCETFISTHKIVFCNGFFTEDGRVTDEMPLRSTIYAELKDYASNNVARKVGSILDLLKLSAQVEDFRPVTNCIHLANGTLHLNGNFQEGKPEVVRNRLPVRYNRPLTGCGSCLICSTPKISRLSRSLSGTASSPATKASG